MAKKIHPVTPGDILLEEFLKPLELSQNKLARELDVPAARINSIIRNTRRITVDMAIRLGRFFNTGPELWLNLQQRYDLKIAEQTIEPDIY
ncbi:HigA family addiction module antidote protein, partial [bacterium]|nr:HigA family addiction module antidote protein [bacterium]